jgi:hypothetical protein
LLAAEGSDWAWWFGPEHSTANDAEFDALFRKHLTGVYLALGRVPPAELAKPIKRKPEHALELAPTGFVNVRVDGRDSSYFEWLGAGLYSPERRGGSMHGRVFYLHELRYGFEEERFCVRVDLFPEVLAELEDTEFRISIVGAEELTVVAKIARGHLREFAVERKNVCLLNPKDIAEVAFDRILEVAIRREAIAIAGKTHLRLGVALWHCGLPVDVLPASGYLDVSFGEEHAAWDVEEKELKR